MQRIAHRAMLERGLVPGFSAQVLAKLDGIHGPATRAGEDAAKEFERQVTKFAAAILLGSRIGEQFDAVVTGTSDKSRGVRLLHPPIEGRLVSGFEGMDVGHRLRVHLLPTDVEPGYINFKRVA